MIMELVSLAMKKSAPEQKFRMFLQLAKCYGTLLAASTARQEYTLLGCHIFILSQLICWGSLFLIVMGGKVNSWDVKATTTFPPWKVLYLGTNSPFTWGCTQHGKFPTGHSR